MVALKNFDDGLLKIHHSLKNKIPGCDPKTVTAKPILNVDDNTTSEYQSVYQNWPYQKPCDCIRPPVQRSEVIGGLDLQTIYREDFTTHQIEKKADCRKIDFEPMAASMHTRTTYDVEFFPKDVDRTMSYKPNMKYKIPATTFNVRSVYQTSYQQADKNTRKFCKPKVDTHRESLDINKMCKFDGESTVQSDYKKPEGVSRPPLIKPMEQDRTSGGKFDGLTLYKQYYGESGKQSPVPSKSLGKKTSMVDVMMPFDNVSTFMADFKPHFDVCRRKCCHPPQSTQILDAPFDGRTEKSVAFKEWPVKSPEKPKWALIKAYKRPSLSMVMDSTYKVDFDPPGLVTPLAPSRPGKANEDIIKHQPGDSRFQWSSRYQTDFQEWLGAEPANDFQIRYKYEPPGEKMLLVSTQRAHFKGEAAKRSDLCRQVSEHRDLGKDDKMQFCTTYRDTYKTSSRPNTSPVKGMTQFATSDSLWSHPTTVSQRKKEAKKCVTMVP
ncbi:hypothetical protein ScPMuIL_000164 [Solemya velum]